ncbi:SpdD-like protein [Streptomyces luteolus]|uniref:SpdD-like protein n=1 Tax=Streptomyces luteolus TaxID=3043615 RepID=A0ABT6SUQ7_9ACTN|nr:SpdD-like protein [Streptomyces sp. B-S-A12]MDI3418569.1 SpdD-like protein [Streptomyces sp. B-S-A12]
MLRPKIPVNDQPTGETIPLTGTALDHQPQPPTPAPTPVAPAASARPAVQLTPGSLALLVGGGTAAVLVVGAVLVSMLLAVAITAGSLAVTALVVRSLMNDHASGSKRF